MKTIVKVKGVKNTHEHLVYIEDDPALHLELGTLVETFPAFQDSYKGEPEPAKITMLPVQVDERLIEADVIRIYDYVCTVYPTRTILHKPEGLDDGSSDDEQDRL